MDVGQSTAAQLWQQATDGTFKMDPDTAKRVADCYTRFADGLVSQIRESMRLHSLSGFGDFASAQQLQQGFAAKGEKLTEALVGTQEAALRMAAAHLRAGGLLSDADAMNQRAINAVGNQLGGRQ